jgi:hypothetical protein
MRQLLRRYRPSPATGLASIALAVSLSGTGYAATQLVPRNSVGSLQVIDRSLLRQDFRPGQIPAGPPGEPGAPGAPGSPGAPGPAGIARIVSGDGPAAGQCGNGGGACQVASATATCPAGSVAIGGGFGASTPDNVVGYAKRGPSAAQYSVIATNFWPSGATVVAHVVCASGPGVSAFRLGELGTARDISAKVAELRAKLEAR